MDDEKKREREAKAREWEAAKKRGGFDELIANQLQVIITKKGLSASHETVIAIVRRRIDAEIFLPGLT